MPFSRGLQSVRTDQDGWMLYSITFSFLPEIFSGAGGGREGKIFCYASLSCYANFSFVLDQNFKGAIFFHG